MKCDTMQKCKHRLAFSVTCLMPWLVGCMHQRLSMLVDVEDLGPQIETRNRYTLVAKGEVTWEVQEQISKVNWELQKAQPNVFAADGIPFVRSGNWWGRTPVHCGPSWTAVFIPLLIFPVMTSGGESGSTCVIDVLDNPDAHASFTVKAKSDAAVAFLSPLPMLCYSGVAGFDGEPEDCRKYSSHTISFAGDTVVEYGDKIDDFGSMMKIWGFNSVDAYGIAAVLKRMEEAGQIDVSRVMKRQRHLQMTESPVNEDFDVIDLHKEDVNGYRYAFSLKSCRGNVTLKASRQIQRELREMIRDDFAASFPAANRSVLIVDFVKYDMAGGDLKGTALILPLDILSFDYDKHTRKGVMKIRVVSALMEEARRYCRKNIESVVRDKNIAHMTGQLPSEARYYLLGEKMKAGLLEIEFKTE